MNSLLAQVLTQQSDQHRTKVVGLESQPQLWAVKFQFTESPLVNFFQTPNGVAKWCVFVFFLGVWTILAWRPQKEGKQIEEFFGGNPQESSNFHKIFRKGDEKEKKKQIACKSRTTGSSSSTALVEVG